METLERLVVANPPMAVAGLAFIVIECVACYVIGSFIRVGRGE